MSSRHRKWLHDRLADAEFGLMGLGMRKERHWARPLWRSIGRARRRLLRAEVRRVAMSRQAFLERLAAERNELTEDAA